MIGPFIFLDIDGVLNGHDKHPNGYCGIDRESVALLNKIITATSAKVVVSSAWRYFVLRGEMTLAGFGGLLCTHGLQWGCVVDVLGPDISDGMGGADRGAAIKEWFKSRYCISHATPYVAIDDMDLGYTKHGIHWVKTTSIGGMAGSLLESEIDDIIGELNYWKAVK